MNLHANNLVEVACARCAKPFYVKARILKRGRGKFCSKKCAEGNVLCADRDWLTSKFYASVYLSVDEIARLAGVNGSTVSKWIKHFGLQRTRRHSPEARQHRKDAFQQPEQQARFQRGLGKRNREQGQSPQQKMFLAYRRGATNRELAFELTLTDITELWGSPCFYCGDVQPVLGLDRKDNNQGYFRANVVPCCKTCNYMKMALPLEVFLAHVDTIRRHMGKPSNWIDKTATIGENSTVWHFANILAEVKIGKNCSIGSHTEIGRGSVIGNDCRISAHVFLPSNSILEDRVFLGPGVTATDDRHPIAGNDSYLAEPPYFESGCSVGARSTILPGVRIGCGAMIGAGAVVTQNVNPHEHVRGEPARVKPYSKIKTETHFDIYASAIRERVIAGEHVRIK